MLPTRFFTNKLDVYRGLLSKGDPGGKKEDYEVFLVMLIGQSLWKIFPPPYKCLPGNFRKGS